MRRRVFAGSFAAFAATVAVLPRSRAAAQPKPMPVIGWLNSGSPGLSAPFVTAFRQGLGESGYVETRVSGRCMLHAPEQRIFQVRDAR